MRGDQSPWRVSDAVAFDAAVQSVDVLVATDGVPEAVELRRSVLSLDGFDRATVGELALPSRRRGDAVKQSSRADEVDLDAVFADQVLPIVFMDARPAQVPSVVLLGGQPGSGRSRAIGRLVNQDGNGTAVISAGLLRQFYPGPANDARTQQSAAAAAGTWLLGCLRHARENHFSLLLDGPFPAPDASAGTLAAFQRDGFRTHLAVVAVSRAESLLALASSYAADRLAGRVATLTPVGVHDNGWDGTRRTLREVGGSPVVDRITVFDRSGAAVYDGADGEAALHAFDGASASPLSTLQAVQWLSELKRVTQVAQSPAFTSPELTPILVQLHEAAIREVVPRLNVPAVSIVSRALESRLAGELVTLRRAGSDVGTAASGPVVTPKGPERGGPSL